MHYQHKIQKRKGKLWTYISDMSGRKSQVDYILITSKWKKSIKNIKTYNSFANFGSDHRLLLAWVKLSLRNRKTPTKGPSYDRKALSNCDIQNRYTIAVKKDLACLAKNMNCNWATSTFHSSQQWGSSWTPPDTEEIKEDTKHKRYAW